MADDIKNEIQSLRRQIREHDRCYYALNNPKISDGQYDKIFSQLKELEKKHPELITPDSPTQRVGGKTVDGFEQITHSVPMLSIDNTYNAEELKSFDQRIAKILGTKNYSYVVELKIDGLAVSLLYQDGILTVAATRGDGTKGENVTANVKTIKSIPLSLSDKQPSIIEVRGEVYMPKKAFALLNEIRVQDGLTLFANPRNAAAGSLKLLDSKITAQRKLAFFAYSTAQADEDFADTHFAALEKLKALALPVNPNIEKADSIEQVIKICDKWESKRYNLDYQIDGMVIKVDNLAQRKILGSTGRAPRWCISYKFAAERAETKITGIDVQVGKTGILTPVANFEPVQLAGTTVKRASLHNFDEVDRLDIRIGDMVLIEKAGEIIPQVVEVKKEARPKTADTFSPPTKCPVCSGTVEKDENGVYIRCISASCPAQFKEKLKYFAGRSQMDIENLGPAVIDQLVDTSMVKDFADLYQLDIFKVINLDRMGQKSAENILHSIEKSKTQSLDRLISALGINHVGKANAEILASCFGSIEAIKIATEEQLTAIDQIGPVMAKSIYEYFRNANNIAVIDKLISAGINPQQSKIKQNNILADKIFVLTGTLENYSRTEMSSLVKQNGGKVSSSISKKTDYLLAGQNAGSKLDKANKLGVKVISEDEFLKMIGR